MTRVAKPGLPDLKIEIAPTATPSTVSPTWVDVTSDLRLRDSVTFNRGRTDERSSSQPGRLSFVLNNAAGNYTPGLASGTYHPLRLRCPVRVSFKPPGAGAYVVMWSGLIDEWSPEWDKGRPVCRVSASDRLAQLQRVELKAWETEQTLAAAPTLLWPFTDDAGSTIAGEVATGTTSYPLTVTASGSGGSGEVGVGALPIDDGTVAAFTPVDVSNGYYFEGTYGGSVADPASCIVSVLMNATSNPASTAVMHSARAADSARLEICVTTGGKAHMRFILADGTTYASLTGATTITDGNWHAVTAAAYRSGTSNISVDLYVDGAQDTLGSSAPGTWPLPSFGSTHRVGGAPGALFSGQISHAAFWTDTTGTLDRNTVAAATYAAMSGATGETSTARFLRVCSLAGVTGATSGTGLSTVGKQKTKGVSALEALDAVGDAELSPAFISAAGVPTLVSRDSRYNAAIALSVTAKDVAPGVSFVLNDQNLVNDVKGTRVGGAEVRQVNAASVAYYGSRTETMSLIVDSDVQMAAVVQWNATVRAEPAPRTDSLRIDGWAKQATVDLDDLLALDVGSRVNVTGLPSTAPAATLDLFTEGIADTFNTDGWQRTLNTSPVGQSGSVWQLDSATYSVLGSTTVLAV